MYKVVVVEDEKLVREGIVHGTEWSRIDCMVAGAAGDGEEGIEAVHKYHPDVIVTDICMPKKSGIEMVESLRKEGNHAVVIFLTAYGEFSYAQQAIKLGAADYEYLKVNYGKMMADSMRGQLESGQLSEKQKEQAKALLDRMEKLLVNDFYIRNTGDKIYVLCQTYSADQAERAAAFLGLLKPYTGVEGWYQNGENWQYKKADGQLALNCWEQDENGLTYHLDGNGNIEYNAWVQENGGWKYADESGHMVTSVTKTINGVQYTFDDKGNMIAGSERTAQDYSLGNLEGNTYTNYWADMTLSFPEAATVMAGNGSAQTYALVGGEHVDVNDPELSYRITVDFTEADMELDRFMDAVVGHGGTDGYKVDASGKVSLGGYEFRYCRTSYDFGDGTAHHSDWYVRQIDSKLVLIHFDYYDELKNQVQQVYDSIRQPQA